LSQVAWWSAAPGSATLDGVFRGLPDLLVSDDEREAVVVFLGRHYEAGRLTEDELSARVDAAYRARYDAQLAALTADLPALPEPAIPAGRLARARPLAAGLLGLAGAVVVADAIPPELWALVLALVLPMLLMVVAMFAPFVLPVLGIAWLARALSRPRREAHRALPPHGRALP